MYYILAFSSESLTGAEPLLLKAEMAKRPALWPEGKGDFRSSGVWMRTVTGVMTNLFLSRGCIPAEKHPGAGPCTGWGRSYPAGP